MDILRWPGSLVRQIKIVQWVLPLLLFLIASGFETLEHLPAGKISFDFGAEVFIFGILGPLAVWWVLGWVARNQTHLEQANVKISHLNSDLEQRVAKRIAELAEKNVILAQVNAELADKNEALARANTELQDLDILKSDFVSLVSHELRAPLTNINGSIELIAREQAALSPARREVLDILRNESTRLTKLVQNILDISLLEAGRLFPTPGPLPLRPFLNQLLKGRLPTTHQLVMDIPHDLPPAWVDETHLANVVINLVDNAVKYSPDGGDICIGVRSKGDQNLTLSVSDQGIGIPPAEQAHLFERFYRANNSADQEVYGHGLGLYFCRKLVDAQGGDIRVESEGIPGQGTTIYLSLPVCYEEIIEHESDFAH